MNDYYNLVSYDDDFDSANNFVNWCSSCKIKFESINTFEDIRINKFGCRCHSCTVYYYFKKAGYPEKYYWYDDVDYGVHEMIFSKLEGELFQELNEYVDLEKPDRITNKPLPFYTGDVAFAECDNVEDILNTYGYVKLLPKDYSFVVHD